MSPYLATDTAARLGAHPAPGWSAKRDRTSTASNALLLGIVGACTASLALPSTALAQTPQGEVAPFAGAASQPSAALASEDAASAATAAYSRAFFDPFAPATALDMVVRIPGFRLQEGPSVRGLAGSFGNVVIDGREHASKSESLAAALARIPADHVESIELFTPASSDLARDGYNLVANVRRRADARSAGAVTLEGRADRDGGGGGKLIVEASVRTGPHDLSGAASTYEGRSHTRDGRYVFLAPEQPSFEGVLDHESRDRGQRLQGNIDRYQGRTEHVSLALDLSKDRGGSDSRIVSRTSQLREQFNSRWRSRDAELTVDLARELTSDLALRALLLHSTAESDYDDAYAIPGYTAQSHYEDRTSETVARFTVSPSQADGWTWVAGLELARNVLEGSSSYIESGLAVPLPAQDVEVSETRGEVFGRLKGPLSAQWRLDAALAYERSRLLHSSLIRTSVTFDDLRPELALTYTPDAKTQVSLSLTRKVGQLDFSDFVTSVAVRDQVIELGNPGLEPERRWRLEAAYHRTFLKRGAATLTVGHDLIDNPIEFIPLAGRDAPGNLGQARVTYANITISAPLDGVGLAGGVLSIDASHRRSIVRDPVTGERRRLEGEVGNSASIVLRQDVPGGVWSWSVDLQAYSESRYYRRALLKRYEARPILGAELEFRPSKAWRLKLRAESGAWNETTQIYYAVSRAVAGVASSEVRELRPGPTAYLTLRRSL